MLLPDEMVTRQTLITKERIDILSVLYFQVIFQTIYYCISRTLRKLYLEIVPSFE